MAVREDPASANDNRMRARAADAYQAARDRTYSAYETARGRAADVTRQAADQIGVYPVAAVLGGLALGALLGALLPGSRRESELLGTTGRRLTGAAKEAAEKGVEAARHKVDQVTGEVVTKVGHAVVEAVGGKG